MLQDVTLVWLRLDLRLEDNPAVQAALERGGSILPVFVWSPDEEGKWPPGAASKWWLHQSLKAFDAKLRQHGSRLVIRKGPSLETLSALVEETKATAIFWGRRYEPAIIARDTAVKTSLRRAGLTAESFNSALLFEPWQVRTKAGEPFKVYTPFWNACRALSSPEQPVAASKKLPAPRKWPSSLKLDELNLEPTIDWAGGLRDAWKPGEDGARKQLKRFLTDAIDDYDTDRDRPDLAGTSSLSPHLHFGEISPRTVWHAVLDRAADRRSTEVFLKELVWREFAYHLLFHFPHTTEQPLRKEFAAFPWRKDRSALRAWRRGQTGYPFVDAGMRQLWTTGWMHNRVRMVVASFLVKHLLIPWQEGARWFWDTLVDADLANNTLGWQWTAGCGADAAPYFRIFNPVAQGERFDPEGEYVQRWVPEVAKDTTYPVPIIDHAEARRRALDAFATLTNRQ